MGWERDGNGMVKGWKRDGEWERDGKGMGKNKKGFKEGTVINIHFVLNFLLLSSNF